MNDQKKEPIHDIGQLIKDEEFAADRDIIQVVTGGKGVSTKSGLRELVEEFRNREVI